MNKTNFTDLQKKQLKIGSYFGFAGIASMIVVIICALTYSSKSEQLKDLANVFHKFELEQAMSACLIVGIVFAIVMLVCVGLSGYLCYKVNKESNAQQQEMKK